MRKIIVSLLCMFLLISMASAFEFDNVKEYDPVKREVLIKNAFGLGDDIATARLISLDRVYINPGYEMVAEFEINNLDKVYQEPIKEIISYDIRKKPREITKTYDYKYWFPTGYRSKDVVNSSCNIHKETCKMVDQYYEEVGEWREFNNLGNLPVGKIKISLWTNVKAGDKVEWIPTLFGVEVPEWATFEAIVREGHEINLGTPQADWGNNYLGLQFQMINVSKYLLEVIAIDPFLAGGGGAEIWNATDNTTLVGVNGSTKVGVFHIFNFTDTNFLLENGTTYIVVFHNNSQTWDRSYQATGAYPFTKTHIKITGGFQAGWGAGRNNDPVGFHTSFVYDPINMTFGSTAVPSGPNVTLISPIANFSTNVSSVLLNCTATDDGNISNITRWVDGTRNGTQSFTSNRTELAETITFGEGYHNWTCSARDNDNNFSIADNRTLLIDSAGPVITITSPSGEVAGMTSVPYNITINFSATDGSLEQCYFNGTYNATFEEITCNTTEVRQVLSAGLLEFWAYANDSSSNLQVENSTFWVGIVEQSQSYANSTIEGATESFEINITINDSTSVTSALLNYNNTINVGSAVNTGANNWTLSADIVIPLVDASVSKNFFWNITLTDGRNELSSSANQTIQILGLDNCSGFTNVLLNFTVVDEELQTNLPNTTVEIAVDLLSLDRSQTLFNFSEITSANPTAVCINNTLNQTINISASYSMDVVVRYEAIGFANEYYNILNQTIDNNTLEEITLYDLNSSDSTEFQLTFIGSDFLPVENALVFVDRQYIAENVFKTVELPKTDSNGQTILHLVRNDVIYNIRILESREVLGSFENIIAFCEDFTIGDCKIDLNAFDTVEEIFNYDEDLGITFAGPTYNDTADTISFAFISPDSSSKNVSMHISRSDVFGNRSVCTTELVSISGTLICTLPSNLDDSTLLTTIFVDGIPTVLRPIMLDTDAFGVGGYFVAFIMVMAMILMFSNSKSGVLFGMLLGFAGAIGFGLLVGSVIGAGASGVWLLVIVVIGLWKLNKGRQQ